MRIVSLLPAATEIVADLGLAGCLVGRSHQCRWPPEVEALPVVSSSLIDTSLLSSGGIDEAVRGAAQRGTPLYALEAKLLEQLRPDVIITQDLCRVCAVSGDDLSQVGAQVVSLGPRTIAEVAQVVRDLAETLGVRQRGGEVAGAMLERIERVRASVRGLPRLRVFLAEWIDPPFASGHWIPEMVEAAGGEEVLGRVGALSVRTTWEAVAHARPDVVIVAPCGFDEERSRLESTKVKVDCPVVAVDADRYFARPAPSIAQGVELLQKIFQRIASEGVPPVSGNRSG